MGHCHVLLNPYLGLIKVCPAAPRKLTGLPVVLMSPWELCHQSSDLALSGKLHGTPLLWTPQSQAQLEA